MTDQVQKFDYLDEHLPYMLGTLRYNFDKISQPQHFRDWNAYFESFAVNARNLIQFLDNADTGNFKASDFVSRFRIRKGDIQGPLAKLRDQVFHLGKSRPRDTGRKFDLAYANTIFAWIEAGMNEFLEGLSKEDRKHWNAVKANPKADFARDGSNGSKHSVVGVVFHFISKHLNEQFSEFPHCRLG